MNRSLSTFAMRSLRSDQQDHKTFVGNKAPFQGYYFRA